MRRFGRLKLLFYINLLIVFLLVFYKLYLTMFEADYEGVHADQVDRIESALQGRSSYAFAVVGNINNSVGLFERKIVPLLNRSGLDFVVSAGNAVSGGGEDKYRALHRTLERLRLPYVLTYGKNEHSAFGGFRYYDHYGPYVFAFSAGNSRFIFLDSSGKTPWKWQLRWLDEELAMDPREHVFLFVGQAVHPVELGDGLLALRDDYLLDDDFRLPLSKLIEQAGVDAVFSADLPLFFRQQFGRTSHVVTGGAGGLVFNNEHSYYHYLEVRVAGGEVSIRPVRLDIGQNRFFRTLESVWFVVHSIFYVGYLNYLIVLGLLSLTAVWLYYAVFTEHNYYPDFDLPTDLALEKPIRVAMFTNNFLPYIGGVPISIDRLRRSLQALGHRVLVFAPSYAGQRQDPEVVRLPRLLSRIGSKELVIANIFSLRLFRQFRLFQPDVLHIHHPFWMGSMGRFLGRRFGVPVVYTYHTRFEHYSYAVPLPELFFKNYLAHKLVRRIGNRCDAVVVPTEGAEHYLRMIGVKSSVFVIPTGIECDRYRQVPEADLDALRRRYDLGAERILLSVSRLSREKNIDFMLEGVRELVRRCKIPFRLLIVGDGPERRRLEQKIAQLQLQTLVLLTGAVSPDQIAAYYRLADIFVFASRTETQGMVVLEAMASGLPVVAVRASGIDDFVKNGVNGFKTGLRHDQWAGRIAEILGDQPLHRRLSQQAETMAGDHDVARFGEKMTRVYAHVLAQRQAAEP